MEIFILFYKEIVIDVRIGESLNSIRIGPISTAATAAVLPGLPCEQRVAAVEYELNLGKWAWGVSPVPELNFCLRAEYQQAITRTSAERVWLGPGKSLRTSDKSRFQEGIGTIHRAVAIAQALAQTTVWKLVCQLADGGEGRAARFANEVNENKHLHF